MKQRRLGNTDIMISPIGLGTVKLGRTEGVKYPTPFKIPSDAQVKSLLKEAQNLGVNALDTAPAYGNSEERLGQLISPVERQAWIIMTKVGEEFTHGVSHYNFSPEHAQYSIERSLKRLNTDYLDVVLVHSDGNDIYNINHYGILDCLAEIKKQGLIRSYGMSTKTIEGGMLALEKSDMAMITYNPIHTSEKPIMTQAQTLQKGILIKKALLSGHIQQLQEPQLQQPHLQQLHQDPVQHSLQFIFQEPAVSSVIIGTINPMHLQQAVLAVYI